MIGDLAFIVVLMAWATGVGRAIVRRLAPLPQNATETFALTAPLGLGVLALALLGLGALGALTPAGLGAVLVLGGAVAVWETLRAFSERRSARWEGPASEIDAPRPSREPAASPSIGLAFDLALAAGVVGSLLMALMPVTDGDALCYHLEVPKRFLEAGAILFEPDLHETVYPLVAEMLYAVALALRGPVACRLVQWAFGLIFAAGVTALAQPVLGRRARWAGAVALLVPAVSNGMGAPLNDVALAAFGNAALLAWLRWYDRPTLGGAVLAGILAGSALGVKYPALIWTGLLGLAMLGGTRNAERGTRNTDRRSPIEGGRSVSAHGVSCFVGARCRAADAFSAIRRRISGPAFSVLHPPFRVPKHALAFGLVALAVGGGWYLRAYHHTGNPVYPFFRHTFGGAGIDDVLDPIKRPLPVTPWNLLTALGPLTLDPDRFDSVAHQFGPAFLLFLPGLLLFRPPRRVAGIVALGWLFLTLCLTQRQSMRFVLIAVGPMAVGVAWLASTWWDRRTLSARALVVALALVLVFEGTIAVGRARHGLGVLLGRESVEAYLARREPTFVVGRWMERHLPPDARLIGQDHRGFYLPRHYTMELAHRRRTGLGTRGETAGEIVATLRRRGFTHLLLCPPEPIDAVEFDPTLSERLAPWVATRTPLYRRDLTDGDGVLRLYALYDLEDGGNLMDADPARIAAGAGRVQR